MPDYRDKTYLAKDSIVIIEPAVEVSAWSVHSGSVYKATAIQKPSRLKRNAVELTLVASIAAVDAATKYYYDGTYVYIYTYAIDDYLTLYFKQYFGTRGFKLPEDLNLSGTGTVVWFEPRVIGDPSFSRTGKDWMSGVTVNGDCSFSLAETDDHQLGDFYTWLDTYSYINKRAWVYRYLSEEDTNQITLVFYGLIDGWAIDKTSINFTAKDYAAKLDDHVQSTEYNTTDYPNVDPQYVGKVIRWCYGKSLLRCVNISYVDQTPTTSDNRVWKITEHANYAVSEVYVRGVLLTLTTHYTLNANKNEITLSATLEADLGWDQLVGGYEEVYALTEGKMDGVGALMDNPSDIIKDLLYSVGFTADDLNTASFAQAKTDCTYKIGHALPQSVDGERPTCREIIERINRSTLGYITNDEQFKIKYKIYAAGSATITLDINTDLIGRAISAQTYDMASQAIVQWDYSERTQNYLTSSKTSKKCQYLHENGKANVIETALSHEADALALAERYIALYENPYITEDFRVKLQLDQHHIGDFISIDGRTLEIIKLDKSVKETNTQARRL